MTNRNLAIIGGGIILIALVAAGVWFFNQNNENQNTELQDNAQDITTDTEVEGEEQSGEEAPTTDDTTSPEETGETTSQPSGGSAPTNSSDEPAPSQPTVKTVAISGTHFQFSQSEIRVKQGDTVRVTFSNTEGTHDWTLPAFGVATSVIQAGQQDTVEFVANKSGSFEYYCSVSNHRQLGMKGTLIVE